jgi:glycosyltransferase involved in cell wall biosynthesis
MNGQRVVMLVADQHSAGARLRALQWVPYLLQDGAQVTICWTRPSKYLPRPSWLPSWPLARTTYCLIGLVAVTVQRVWQLAVVIPTADVVLLHKDLLHRVPSAALERLLTTIARRRRVRVVLDLDDATYLGTSDRWSPRHAGKVAEIAGRATVVLAGSPDIARAARTWNPRTYLLPTCVDAARSVPRRRHLHRRGDPLRLLWVGMPANLRDLLDIIPALWCLEERLLELTIVTNLRGIPSIEPGPLRLRLVAWSPERERLALDEADLGLAPLRDTPWSRAKCGARVLSYLSAALPVIASPVGVQGTLVQDGVTGLTAKTMRDWPRQVRRLAADSDLRLRIGAAGRQLVSAGYAPEVWYPRLREILLTAPDARSSPMPAPGVTHARH